MLDQILRFIIALRLPFNLVEHPQFRKMMTMVAAESLKLPSRTKLKSRLIEISGNALEQQLRQVVPNSKISLAVDCWTSPQQLSFLGVTGYFINIEWQYQEILLGFEPLSGQHSGENLAHTLFKVLEQNKLISKVLAITTDNASNNATMMSTLREQIDDLRIETELGDSRIDTILSGQDHIPCLAHIIQLSLKDLLGSIKAGPVNDEVSDNWDSEKHIHLKSSRGIPLALEKVTYNLILNPTSVRLRLTL